MNLADLEALIAVAETGSVQRAALRLGRTQPAVTRRLQTLEAALGGAPLLDRGVKPPRLTSLGRRVLAEARQVLRAVAALHEAAGTDAARREVRIGIAHSLSDLLLTAPVEALRRDLARVRWHISADWTERLIVALRAGALDCAIVLMTGRHRLPPGLVATALGTETVVVVAARHTRLPDRRLRISDLAELAWVLHPSDCVYRAALIGYSVSALVIGVAVLAGRQVSSLARGGGWWFVAVGACNGGAVLAMYAALARAPVRLVAPLVATYPLVTVAGEVLAGAAPLSWRRTAGVAVTIVGTIVLITQ